jgi:diguanylate cyclase (GGDEF)-like protein
VLAVGSALTTLAGQAPELWNDAGCRIACVQTGVEGLRELLTHSYALVLVSAGLPDFRTTVFLAELARLAPRTLVATAAPLPATLRARGQVVTLPPLADAAQLRASVKQLLAGLPAAETDGFSTIIHSLNHVEDAIVDTSRTKDALGSVCLELVDLAESEAVALYLQGTTEPHFLVASRRPLTPEHLRFLTRDVEKHFVRLTQTPAHFPSAPRTVVSPHRTDEAPLAARLVAATGVPLLAEHQIKGVLCAAFTSKAARDRCAPSPLFHLANHAVLIHQEIWRARHMAARDLLTGLYNRSMFTESLKQAFSLALRKGTPVGLLLFDFDNLKSINDQHGHLAGDKVLREAASLTLATARTSDIVARFGGDEFAVILPETNLQDAHHVAERLLAAFRERQFGGPTHPLRITISIGVAAIYPTRETGSQTLLLQADEGLLAAKHNGKDRVCGAPGATDAVPAVPAAPPSGDTPRGRVLILDDEPSIRQILGQMLTMMRFEVTSTATLDEALLAIETVPEDFDLVLTDLHLGNGTGIDLLQALKSKAPWTVKLVVSAYASKETAIECLRHGAFDFIEKPFALAQIRAAMDRALDHRKLLVANRRYQNQLEELVRQRSERLAHALESLRRSYSQTIQTLALMIDAREAHTGMHCRIAREAVRLLVRQMNISHHDLETIEMGAMLHDIGKLGIPDAILQKPGPLTPEEQQVMRRHPRIGYDLLAGAPFLHDVAEIVLQHHEAFDGSGYPEGLTGDQICIGARVFAVIDAYHAMRSMRCYRPALDEETACAEIVRCSGRQFDPAAVTAFLACRSEIETVFAGALEKSFDSPPQRP